jgi:hypothetical protein
MPNHKSRSPLQPSLRGVSRDRRHAYHYAGRAAPGGISRHGPTKCVHVPPVHVAAVVVVAAVDVVDVVALVHDAKMHCKNVCFV